MNCKNKGKFGHKVGRPSRKMYKALETKKEFVRDPHGSLKDLASVDIREVDPDLVSEYDEAALGEAMGLAEWLRTLAGNTYNPFIFKCGGMLVKMGGMERKTGFATY